MSYGLVFKILMTISIAFACVGIITPTRRTRVWKTFYAISVVAVALNAIAFLWMK